MHIGKRALAFAIAAACAAPILISSASAVPKPEPAPKTSALSGGASPHFKYPQHAKPSGGSVLYDQTGPYDNGAPNQYFQASFSAYNSEAADDFVVTDAMGWSVSAFNFEVQFVDSNTLVPPPPSATYDITIFADAGGSPGASVCDYGGLIGTVDASNTNLSVALPNACVLAQGTYWVSFESVFDLPPQAFWSTAAGAPIGAGGVWRNPGGAFGTTCSAWSDVASCSNSVGAIDNGDPNFLFQVIGAVGNAGNCGVGQLCLASTVGTDLSPSACATTDTIDATIGDQLNFCYTITNNTGVELDYQSLQNNIDGTLLNDSQHALAPGGTYQFNHIETVATTNIYNATWTAQDLPSGYLAALESGGGNCGDRIFADGFENSMPACSGGNFVDITGTGTAVSLSDDGSVDVLMPFSFDFYGTTSNLVTIANNGGALFNSPGASLGFSNEPLPSNLLPWPAFLPLWDDFDATSGAVYYDTRGAAPNRQFIVEWSNRVHFSGPANTDGATFELILNEDGTIQFEYADVDYTANNSFSDPPDCTGGVCATIGLQNDSALFNQFSALTAAVTDHSGIKWTPTNPMIFTASDTATVNVGAPQIVVNPSTIVGTVAPGGTSTIPFAIENHGDRDLQWTLDEAASSNLHFPPPGTRFAMPFGDPADRSLAPAPHTAHAKKSARKHAPAPFAAGAVQTFAADLGQANFETFDADAPQTVDIVAPISDGTAYTGGAFINGNFSTFYAIAGPFGSNPDNLYAIDTSNGTPTLIGSATNVLGEGYEGLAYDSTSQHLYAASSDCSGNSHLWTLDAATATPTEVGAISGPGCLVAIAVNALGEMYGLDLATDALWAIDKTNGASWELVPKDTTAGQVNTIVRFDKAASRNIMVPDNTQAKFIDTGATWPVDMYFNIEIDMERSNGTLVICKDGVPIYLDDTGVSVGGWNVTQAIVQQDIESGSTAANTLFIDDLAVDNPMAPACAEAAGLLKAPPKPPGSPVRARAPMSSFIRSLGR